MASSSSGSYDNVRQTLVDRLLDAVKQCQIRFGGKTELATDRDSRVSCLCAQWEMVLQFGIKSNRKINPLRHVAGQVLLRPEGESVWWQFLKEHLSATEIRRFNSLQNVNNDVGRARAWLRSALNEQSLEKYLHSFLGNHSLLSSYYELEALLMDEERSSMLPMMAAGLSSILFAINIDNPEFNASKQSSANGPLSIQLGPAPIVSDSWHAPSPTYPTVQGKEKKKRKKKKANIAIPSIENVDFEENYDQEEEKETKTNDEKRDVISSDFRAINRTDSIGNTPSVISLRSDSNSFSRDLRNREEVSSNLSLGVINQDRTEYINSKDNYGSASRNVTNQNRKEHDSSVISLRNNSDSFSTDLGNSGEISSNISLSVMQQDRTECISSKDNYASASRNVTNQNRKEHDSSENKSSSSCSKLVQGEKDLVTSVTVPQTENTETRPFCYEKISAFDNPAKPNASSQSDSRIDLGRVSKNAGSDGVTDTAEDEPLVEMSSGAFLTPVKCPDEATLCAIRESNDSESPGTEIEARVIDGSLPVLSRLFAGRDSPVSSLTSGFTTDDDVSEDANLAIDATEAALTAAQDVHREMADYSRRSLVRTMGDGRTSPSVESASKSEMTSAELKQAIVSMMLRKDEVEECNRSLRQLLDKEMMESAALRSQVEDLRLEKTSSEEAYQTTVQALSCENTLLKHQLKKYVAAVQSLRRNEPIDIAVPGSRQEDNLPVLPERNRFDDESSKDVEIDYERKLVQVADMHGELIELNERLQKMLNIREHQLRRLREDLVNLRGPLPDDGNQEDSLSLNDFGPRLVSVNTRALINIWIPSAFAQGKSSNVHHTYQVYVRIKDDEWNVYRRYSHFHDMHKKMCKQYPGINNFKFPQKKVMGNRDAKFVEIRRRHLQSYLRKLINYALRVIPELSENPSKSLLLKYFPFFCSPLKDKQVSAPGGSTQTHYTGL